MMADKKKHVQVVPTGTNSFDLIEGGRVVTELVFNKNHEWIDKRKMKRSDHFRIFFYLDPADGYRFDTTKKDGVIEIDGHPCPYPSKDPEFEVRDVEDYVLEVANRDRNVQNYDFTIMLVNGTRSVEYDPIMSNRNGGL